MNEAMLQWEGSVKVWMNEAMLQWEGGVKVWNERRSHSTLLRGKKGFMRFDTRGEDVFAGTKMSGGKSVGLTVWMIRVGGRKARGNMCRCVWR
jgi:hypothetical protein